MNLKHAMIGVAIGSVFVVLVKREDFAVRNAHDSHSSTAETPQVLPTRTVQRTTIRSSLPAAEQEQRPSTSTEMAPVPNLLGTQAFASRQSIPNNADRLKELWVDSIAEARVSTPRQRELDDFEQLFLITLQNQTAWEMLRRDWAALGWDIERFEARDQTFLAIYERSDQRCGRGFYVIRVGTQASIALQAPHRFYDAKTGWLTYLLFQEQRVAAAGWNTVHRSQIDVAHRSDHYMNAMTRALIQWNNEIVVAQIHGFANEKQTGFGNSASIIISDATHYPGRLVQRACLDLKERFGADAVRLFPTEVSELGGTLNQQARVFHSLGRSGFLHVELNRSLREKLASDASTRAEFFSGVTPRAANRTESRSR